MPGRRPSPQDATGGGQVLLPQFDPPVGAPEAAPLRPGPSAAAPAAPPVLWRHLRSNREAELGGHRIGYELQRARRRSIGFVVGREGLCVRAPRWVGQGEIDQALQSKAGWILRKLADQQARQDRLAAARVDWRDGAVLPYLGRDLCLRLAPQDGAMRLVEGADGCRELYVGLPQDADAQRLREAVQGWLQGQALALFEQRCARFAMAMGVTQRLRRLRLSSARTRWGSASSDGTVRLNWRLIHFALPTIDYVVAHELAHLREMNHGPAFWEVLRAVMPDYEQRRGGLRDGQVPVFD